jgi:hypothetical protein
MDYFQSIGADLLPLFLVHGLLPLVDQNVNLGIGVIASNQRGNESWPLAEVRL